jgi:hypothetical protein
MSALLEFIDKNGSSIVSKEQYNVFQSAIDKDAMNPKNFIVDVKWSIHEHYVKINGFRDLRTNRVVTL